MAGKTTLFLKCVPRDGILISAEDNPTAIGRDEELQVATYDKVASEERHGRKGPMILFPKSSNSKEMSALWALVQSGRTYTKLIPPIYLGSESSRSYVAEMMPFLAIRNPLGPKGTPNLIGHSISIRDRLCNTPNSANCQKWCRHGKLGVIGVPARSEDKVRQIPIGDSQYLK